MSKKIAPSGAALQGIQNSVEGKKKKSPLLTAQAVMQE